MATFSWLLEVIVLHLFPELWWQQTHIHSEFLRRNLYVVSVLEAMGTMQNVEDTEFNIPVLMHRSLRFTRPVTTNMSTWGELRVNMS